MCDRMPGYGDGLWQWPSLKLDMSVYFKPEMQNYFSSSVVTDSGRYPAHHRQETESRSGQDEKERTYHLYRQTRSGNRLASLPSPRRVAVATQAEDAAPKPVKRKRAA